MARNHFWGINYITCEEIYTIFFLSFLVWGETGSTGYISRCLAYCTSPGWQMMLIVQHSVEWELAGETEVLRENLPQCHFVSTTNPTWPDLGSNPGRASGKPSTKLLSYGTALHGIHNRLWICTEKLIKNKLEISNHFEWFHGKTNSPGWRETWILSYRITNLECQVFTLPLLKNKDFWTESTKLFPLMHRFVVQQTDYCNIISMVKLLLQYRFYIRYICRI
jgi:hypothetical protein